MPGPRDPYFDRGAQTTDTPSDNMANTKQDVMNAVFSILLSKKK